MHDMKEYSMRSYELDTTRRPARNPRTIGQHTESIMGRRFDYVRMSGKELVADLKQIHMPPAAFARITGMRADRLQAMMWGKEDIPPWIPVFTAVLKNVPGAIPEARQEAAERIIRDLSHPERGEFPYLEKEVPDDDDS